MRKSLSAAQHAARRRHTIRALKVLGPIAGAIAIALIFYGPGTAAALAVYATPIFAIATMPKLAPGEYDLPSIAAAVMALLVSVVIWIAQPEIKVRYDRFDDPGRQERSY